ncbi:MAG: hypothetical protein AAGB46_11405 [Verrucomicrobiota bacterium]
MSSLQQFGGRSRKRVGGTLFYALLIQGVLLLGTLFVIVLDPPEKDPPVFTGKGLAAPQKDEREAKRKLDRFMERTSRPIFADRLTANRSLLDDLPALPALPADAFDFDGAEGAVFEETGGFLGESGLSQIAAMGSEARTAASFFGVRDTGTKIVIVVNTSASVVRKAREAGVSIEAIQDEVAKMVEGLSGNASFGIVQFSQGARQFAPYLAPAIAGNKEAAIDWVRNELRGNPRIEDKTLLGHEAGLEAALDLGADLVFLVTDGVLNKRVKKNGKYSYPEISYDVLISGMERAMRNKGLKPKVHVVGFQVREKDSAGLERLVRRFRGSLKIVDVER